MPFNLALDRLHLILAQPATSSSKGSYVDEPITPPPYNAKASKRSYVDEPITPSTYSAKTSERSYVDEPITPKPETGKTYVDEPITPKPETGKTYVDEPITPKPKSGKTYVDEPITPKPDTRKSYVDEPGTQCGVNERLNGCGNLCEGKCENLGKGPIACPAICGPPACACKEGYYRNFGGVCVTVRDCPLVCGNNEEIDNCGNLCEPTCENAFGKPKGCIKICAPPACVCKSNFYRKDGKCVPKTDCPAPSYGKGSTNTYVDEPITPPPNGKTTQNYVDEPNTKCSVNETLSECGNICEGKCENIGKGDCESITVMPHGPIACPAVCEPPACACKDGYFRNKDGNCVKTIDCSLSKFHANRNISLKRTISGVLCYFSSDCCDSSSSKMSLALLSFSIFHKSGLHSLVYLRNKVS
ncbi:trypsin Inhibitor like cysteine rich domain protein [Ancylostoma duodenale]|uniref:Trypsin Inhibitor like cysteine rich domain protein n=1 Tax=Ancylostoma duodenale TaxID=51022 RepID=A0A0C2DB56_9BILA|nr:trypsin Inhibitor like cysteine rich domain protein [Ancylostoma duodenale]